MSSVFQPQFGWPGKKLADAAFAAMADQFVKFEVPYGAGPPARGGRYFLHTRVRKALAKYYPRKYDRNDIRRYPQATGDCVAASARTAVATVIALNMFHGDAGEFVDPYIPYFYSTSRCLIGNYGLRGQPGSYGSWLAKATERYGVLPDTTPGLPTYNRQTADYWGDHPPDGKFLQAGQTHPIKQTAPIHSWDDLVQAIANDCPCTLASEQGFEMLPRSDGFHMPSGRWPHQMAVTGVDDDSRAAYALIDNNWGDVHGQLVDFVTGELWPRGTMRVRRETVEHMIQTGECIAYSRLEAFTPTPVSWTG